MGEYGGNQFCNRLLHIRIVAYCSADGHITGTPCIDSFADELSCIDQQPSTGSFIKSLLA